MCNNSIRNLYDPHSEYVRPNEAGKAHATKILDRIDTRRKPSSITKMIYRIQRSFSRYYI